MNILCRIAGKSGAVCYVLYMIKSLKGLAFWVFYAMQLGNGFMADLLMSPVKKSN